MLTSEIGQVPLSTEMLEASLHQGLQLPHNVSVDELRSAWGDVDERDALMAKHPDFRGKYEDIAQNLLSFSKKIALVLRRAAENPQEFGVDVRWRETQIQMLQATALSLEKGFRHLAFEIPTGVGKSMLLGAYVRAFLEACREEGTLGEVEAILFTSRANLVLQLAGETFRGNSATAVEKEDADQIEPEEDDDPEDDPSTNWGDVKRWIAPILDEENMRLVTGETGLAEREKDATFTVMTYQGFATIPQESLKRTKKVGLVVFDEAHRLSRRVRDEIKTRFPTALRIGGSATMKGPPSSRPFEIFERVHTGRDVFHDQLAYYASLTDTIERKELKAVRCLQKGVAIDLSDVSRTSSGNLNQKELTRKMMYNIPVLAQFVREAFTDRHPVLELAGAKPLSERTIVASVKRIAIAMRLSKICNEEFGIRANWTSGFDNKELFKRKIQALARKDIQILFSAGKLGEGLDVEEVDAVMSLWPYNRTSAWVLKQMIGRGMRLHEGDKDCLVVEPIFEAGEHTLATTPELFKAEETYPGVLLSPHVVRLAEMKIVKALNDGMNPQEIWNTVLTDAERQSAADFGWEENLKKIAGGQLPTIPIVRNERYIKEILRRKRRRESVSMSHEEVVEEALRELRRKDIDLQSLGNFPSAVFAQMRFGPFNNGTTLYNQLMNAKISILVQEHMQRLAEYLLSDRAEITEEERDEETDAKIRTAAQSIRGMMNVEAMKTAQTAMQMRFPAASWSYAHSDEGVIELMKGLWRKHDLLKGAMLDAVDPLVFKAISLLFKAAKLCRQFDLEQLSPSALVVDSAMDL